MSNFNMNKYPHRRYNPLTGEWLLVSPHRSLRPWNGKEEEPQKVNNKDYDEGCYLCPDNIRVNGVHNPKYDNCYVFTNDFSALLPDVDISLTIESDDLFKAEPVKGECRVICFSPNHSKTISLMSTREIGRVIDTWQEQYNELKQYKYVQIFENKGAIQGCSNPHPHGQVWAGNFIPEEIGKEIKQQKAYYEKHGTTLLGDYVKRELALNERVVCETKHWVVIVPFWAFWPYETILLPKMQVSRFNELTAEQKEDLAVILKMITVKYDNLFNCLFPYSMGWHSALNDDNDYKYWTLHAHFYPPLLRSQSVKKFVAGYELLAEKQRDITPEDAANRLKQLSVEHYSVKEGA